MRSTTPFSDLSQGVRESPGGADLISAAEQELHNDIGLFELRQALGITQVDQADAMGVAQGRISKLEHADDLQLSTLLNYLAALGRVNVAEVRASFEVADFALTYQDGTFTIQTRAG